MDLEQLSKSQIILLSLLITFVTSIATGIVTVSLMDQAPPAIAQAVNRVIERTVERVVPSGQTAASTVITQEKTVVVKESDPVAQAVAKTSPSLVRLYSSGSGTFIGLGLVLNASGGIVSDTGALGDAADANVALADGTRVRAFVTSRDNKNGLAFLQAATSSDEKATAWAPATLAASHPVLGESVVVMAGKTADRIADGIITALVPRSGAGDLLETNIPEGVPMMGSPLINTDGAVVGISTEAARAISAAGFISAAALIPGNDTMKETSPTDR